MRRPELIARQAACPTGLLGRLIGHVMARETAEANRMALELLELKPTDHLLEVGFGHGKTIGRAAAAVSRGFVAGIDPSSEMCRMATRGNRRHLAQGRVEVRQACAEAIPYPAARFDKALTVHTVYFWPDLSRPLVELARVLKPEGRLVLVHRSDARAGQDFPKSVYRLPSEREVEGALRHAGFSSVVTRHDLEGSSLFFHAAQR